MKTFSRAKALLLAGALTSGAVLIAHSNAAGDHDHDHASHDHSGHDHASHDQAGPAEEPDGDKTLTLPESEQARMGIQVEEIEIREVVNRPDGIVALPLKSVMEASGQPFIYLRSESDASRFERVEVQLGDRYDRYVEAVSGVFPGDHVIVQESGRVEAPRAPEVAAPLPGHDVRPSRLFAWLKRDRRSSSPSRGSRSSRCVLDRSGGETCAWERERGAEHPLAWADDPWPQDYGRADDYPEWEITSTWEGEREACPYESRRAEGARRWETRRRHGHWRGR